MEIEKIIEALKKAGFSGELSEEEARFIYEFLEEEHEDSIKQ